EGPQGVLHRRLPRLHPGGSEVAGQGCQRRDPGGDRGHRPHRVQRRESRLMKLTSFRTANGDSYGLVDGNDVYDLGSRLGPTCPDLRSAISQGALAQFASLPGSVAPDHAFDQLALLPVIPNPGKIICVGLNYVAHREETGRAATAAPTLFLRVAESQTAHGQPLLCPRESDSFDFEGEVALVIGKAGDRISEADALSHVAGLSCYNDGSVRDFQSATTQWTAGKNFRRTGAFGPWMV